MAEHPPVVAIINTSPDIVDMLRLAGSNRTVYEVVGKPVDLDAIVRAVKEAVRARPTA